VGTPCCKRTCQSGTNPVSGAVLARLEWQAWHARAYFCASCGSSGIACSAMRRSAFPGIEGAFWQALTARQQSNTPHRLENMRMVRRLPFHGYPLRASLLTKSANITTLFYSRTLFFIRTNPPPATPPVTTPKVHRNSDKLGAIEPHKNTA